MLEWNSKNELVMANFTLEQLFSEVVGGKGETKLDQQIMADEV